MPGSSRGPVVACAAYAGGRRVADVAIEDISEVLTQDDRFVWIGLYEPDEPLLKEVQAEFGLHDLAIEDAHLAHQRPKLERYGDSLFIALRTAQPDREQRRVAFGETHLFVGTRYVVSVRHGASLSYADVRTRCEAAPQLLAKRPGFVLHAIRLSEKVDGLRELLGTALEANLSLTTIAQNEATKRITGWAAIFAIPTMIAGIYGMNFEFMPELRWRWGYPVVMTVTVFLCGLLYYRFRRSGWL